MISCKHKAHSGQSVNASDEEDVSDRVRSHEANGFIGFYSTAISSPLARKLQRLKSECEVKVFDPEDIETILLDSVEGRRIAKRYFPISYKDWESYIPELANLLNKYESLDCVVCGRDLLDGDISSQYEALVALVRKDDEDYDVRRYVDVYWACKGKCDEQKAKSYSDDHSTSWEDITDLLIPANYVRWHIGIINEMYDGTRQYNRASFEKLKEFTIKLAQLVVRNRSDAQGERLKDLAELPPGI